MADLTRFEDDIEGLDSLCERALEAPTDGQVHKLLVTMLSPSRRLLRVPTGLGSEMDQLVENAAAAADAVLSQETSGTEVRIAIAVRDLRHHLITIAGEIARLKEL